MNKRINSPAYTTSTYLGEALAGGCNRNLLNKLAAKVRASGVEFDAIAVRGCSGMLMGPALAMRMNKGIIMVRKDRRSSHSGYDVEGPWDGCHYIIVDDFIASGETVRTIVDAVADFSTSKCVGIFCYLGEEGSGDYKSETEIDGIPVFCVHKGR